MTAVNLNRVIRGPVTAVPVVAGKGVRLVADTENNRWIVEADETVLWDTKIQAVPNAEITLSELASNFESIKVWMTSNDLSWSIICEFPGVATRWEPSRWSCDSSNYTIRDATNFAMNTTNNLKWVCKYSNRLQWNSNGTWNLNNSATAVYINRVVGVNRIASN